MGEDKGEKIYQMWSLNFEETDGTFRKTWIRWMVEFIQTDLKNLSESERMRLRKQVEYFTSNEFYKVDWDEYETAVDELMGEGLKLMDEQEMESLQKELKAFIDRLEGFVEYPEQDGALCHLPLVSGDIYIKWERNAVPGNVGRFQIDLYPEGDDKRDWIFLTPAMLLRGREVHCIRKCKGCGRYFSNFTRIRKVYCNSSCASRSIMRATRKALKEDPKKYRKYLDKQNKYSKARYLKLRRTQFGPNVRVGRKG